VASATVLRAAIARYHGESFAAPRLPRDPLPRPRERRPVPRLTPLSTPVGPEPVLLTEVKRPAQGLAVTRLSDTLPGTDPATPEPIADETPIPLTQPAPLKRVQTLPGIPSPLGPELPCEALRQAADRDEVAAILLSYAAQIAKRSALLVMRRGALSGYDGCGEQLDLGALRTVSVGLESPSLLRDAVATRLPYRGPLPDSQGRRALAEAFGGAWGDDTLLLPVAIGEKVVCLLVADEIAPPVGPGALRELAAEAGRTYERLIRAARA
jgi:hypothetical protein